MTTELAVCVFLALCVVAPAVLVLIALRQLYTSRFRRNQQRHLDDIVRPSVYTIGGHDEFYASNLTLNEAVLIDGKLSPELKVRAYIASIPAPPSFYAVA